MKNRYLFNSSFCTFAIIVISLFAVTDAKAQIATASRNLVANKITNGVLPFDIKADGYGMA